MGKQDNIYDLERKIEFLITLSIFLIFVIYLYYKLFSPECAIKPLEVECREAMIIHLLYAAVIPIYLMVYLALHQSFNRIKDDKKLLGWLNLIYCLAIGSFIFVIFGFVSLVPLDEVLQPHFIVQFLKSKLGWLTIPALKFYVFGIPSLFLLFLYTPQQYLKGLMDLLQYMYLKIKEFIKDFRVLKDGKFWAFYVSKIFSVLLIVIIYLMYEQFVKLQQNPNILWVIGLLGVFAFSIILSIFLYNHKE